MKAGCGGVIYSSKAQHSLILKRTFLMYGPQFPHELNWCNSVPTVFGSDVTGISKRIVSILQKFSFSMSQQCDLRDFREGCPFPSILQTSEWKSYYYKFLCGEHHQFSFIYLKVEQWLRKTVLCFFHTLDQCLSNHFPVWWRRYENLRPWRRSIESSKEKRLQKWNHNPWWHGAGSPFFLGSAK